MTVNASTTLSALNTTELVWGTVSSTPAPALGQELVRRLADLPTQHAGRPLKAYLLLDCWKENPLALALQAEFPEAAKQRCPIPDPLYQGRQDDAPCLVPVPQVLWPVMGSDSLAQSLAQDWLAHWLHAAWEEVQERLVRQHFCAVLVSRQGMSHVAKHLARLGFQYPPVMGSQVQGTARLFRYQDPRVMQSVWPALSIAQRKCWLGSIHAWWSLPQAWGPWGFSDSEPQDVDPVPEHAVQWVRMVLPQEASGAHAPALQEHLFHAEQWKQAHWWPVAQRIWASYRRRQVPVSLQPDGISMRSLLGQGLQVGLNEQELSDFVWGSWLITHSTSMDMKHAAAVNWKDADCAALLSQALNAYHQAPELGLLQYLQKYKQALLQHLAINSSN